MCKSKPDNAVFQFEIGEAVTMKPDELQFHPDWEQPDFSDAEFSALKGSIQECGQLDRVLVQRLEDGAYVVVDGERRLQAIRELGLMEIHCAFVEGSPEIIRYVVNTLRKNQTAMQEAEALQKFLDIESITKKELANIIGKTASVVTDITSLNKLSDYVKDKARFDIRISRATLLRIYTNYKDDTDMQKRAIDTFINDMNAHEKGRDKRAEKQSQYYKHPKFPIRKFTNTIMWMEKYFDREDVSATDKLIVFTTIREQTGALLDLLDAYKENLGWVDSDDEVA